MITKSMYDEEIRPKLDELYGINSMLTEFAETVQRNIYTNYNIRINNGKFVSLPEDKIGKIINIIEDYQAEIQLELTEMGFDPDN
jgi:hypothetical protein